MQLKATVQIGKGGISDGVIEEIIAQLKKKKVVKIKFLKNADRSDFRKKIESIALRANAEIVEIRGFTAILKKR